MLIIGLTIYYLRLVWIQCLLIDKMVKMNLSIYCDN